MRAAGRSAAPGTAGRTMAPIRSVQASHRCTGSAAFIQPAALQAHRPSRRRVCKAFAIGALFSGSRCSELQLSCHGFTSCILNASWLRTHMCMHQTCLDQDCEYLEEVKEVTSTASCIPTTSPGALVYPRGCRRTVWRTVFEIRWQAPAAAVFRIPSILGRQKCKRLRSAAVQRLPCSGDGLRAAGRRLSGFGCVCAARNLLCGSLGPLAPEHVRCQPWHRLLPAALR